MGDPLLGGEEPDVPLVTVRGGPTERVPHPRTGAAQRAVALVLAAATVVGAVVQGQREERPRRERRIPAPVAAELRLGARGVTVSQGGVLVVPVVLQDRGPGLTVTSVTAYAEPVREDPVASPPDEVGAGRTGRFVVLLTPDCDLLTVRSRLAFRASLLLQLEQAGARRQLVLDLGGDRSVARLVDGLCGASLSDRRRGPRRSRAGA